MLLPFLGLRAGLSAGLLCHSFVHLPHLFALTSPALSVVASLHDDFRLTCFLHKLLLESWMLLHYIHILFTKRIHPSRNFELCMFGNDAVGVQNAANPVTTHHSSRFSTSSRSLMALTFIGCVANVFCCASGSRRSQKTHFSHFSLRCSLQRHTGGHRSPSLDHPIIQRYAVSKHGP